MPALGGGLGVVGVIVFLAIQLLGGGAAFDVPSGFDGSRRARAASPSRPAQDPDNDLRDFSLYVFTDVQDAWTKTFAASGERYDRAKLVLYRGATRDGVRPRPGGDRPVLLPGRPARVPGPLVLRGDGPPARRRRRVRVGVRDRARGRPPHPEQLGTSDQVQQARREHPGRGQPAVRPPGAQADCYAGVWARSVYDQLEDGDIEEAFRASEAVGDDRLQRNAGRRSIPDSFTHGSSAQRLKWFKRGPGAASRATATRSRATSECVRRSASSGRSRGTRPRSTGRCTRSARSRCATATRCWWPTTAAARRPRGIRAWSRRPGPRRRVPGAESARGRRPGGMLPAAATWITTIDVLALFARDLGRLRANR